MAAFAAAALLLTVPAPPPGALLIALHDGRAVPASCSPGGACALRISPPSGAVHVYHVASDAFSLAAWAALKRKSQSKDRARERLPVGKRPKKFGSLKRYAGSTS